MDIETVIKQLEYWDKYGQETGNFQYNVYTKARDMLIKVMTERDEALAKLAAMESQKVIPDLPHGFNHSAYNRHTGEWVYLNHANTWQLFQGPLTDPSHSQQSEQSTNVWESALLDAANAVVHANQNNTGYEPSRSLLACRIDDLREILDDANNDFPGDTDRCPSHESEGE